MTERTVIGRFSGPYHFLSNFYPTPVEHLGVVWPTAEHAFQASKCVDPAQRALIAGARSPGHAKRIGRTVRLHVNWDFVRYDVMLAIVRVKFAAGTRLAAGLLATGDAQLVEGNDWCDQVWGDCLCGEFTCREPGANMLGRTLELVRDELMS